MPRQYIRRKAYPTRKLLFPIGPSIAYIPLTQGLFALVDADDALHLSAWNWYAIKGRDLGGIYVGRMGKEEAKRMVVRLHRQIMSPPKHLVIDHKNHNPLDNRRGNLWVCTQKENMQNIRPSSKRLCRGQSFVVKVYWHTRDQRWRVRTLENGKDTQIGSFRDFESAENLRKYTTNLRSLKDGVI